MTTVTSGEPCRCDASGTSLNGSDRSSEAPEGPLLIVSPHFDDAALSCAALLERSEPVDVLNVFTGEPDPPQRREWDLGSGFADSAVSMAARRAEERAAFTGSVHRLEQLDLLDSQYLYGERAETDRTRIETAIAGWGEQVAGGTIALPAGAGRAPSRTRARLRRLLGEPGPERHPDHALARDAALGALGGLPHLVPLLYEELPYLWGVSAPREARKVARASRRRIVPLVLPVDRVRKAQRIAAYASQVPQLVVSGKSPDDPAVLPHLERYWWLPPA